MTTYSLLFKMESIHYFYFIFRLLIIFQFIFPILTIDLRQEDDEAVVAFMGGSDQFDQFCTEKLVTIKQSKENLAQISGIYLGALFYLRKEWGSDKTFGLELDDPTKLGQFHENLDILYEYFYNVYAAGGHSSTVVKPKFVTIDTLNHCLTTIMQNMVKIWEAKLEIKSKLIKEDNIKVLTRKMEFSDFISRLSLVNEDELDYSPEHKPFKKQKIDDANKSKRIKFDRIMEKTYKKAEKKLLEVLPREVAYIYDMEMALGDKAFVAFVKGNNEHLANIVQMYGQRDNAFKVFNSDKFEQWLVLLHLMKKHWDCAKINRKSLDWQCVRKRNELARLYEYFANVHGGIEGLVKPQFYKNVMFHYKNAEAIRETENVPLSKALISMNIASILMFGPNFDEASNANHHNATTFNQFHEIGVQMAFDWKDEKKTSATDIKSLMQHNFDQYLNDLLQKWIKKGLEKKAKLDALEKQIMNDEGAAVEVQQQYDGLKFDYDHHPVFGSPFFDITL